MTSNEVTKSDRGLAIGWTLCIMSGLILGSAGLRTSPASACWDGFFAQHEQVTVYGGDTEWSPDRVRELALWVPRLQALIGQRAMDVYFDNADVDELGSVEFPEGHYDVLFRLLAQKFGVSQAEQRAAMAIEIAPLTIQIAATRDRARAEALVDRLMARDQSDDELEAIDGVHGFFEAGGFPADNASFHVVEKTGDDGAPVYQVLAGAFLVVPRPIRRSRSCGLRSSSMASFAGSKGSTARLLDCLRGALHERTLVARVLREQTRRTGRTHGFSDKIHLSVVTFGRPIIFSLDRAWCRGSPSTGPP